MSDKRQPNLSSLKHNAKDLLLSSSGTRAKNFKEDLNKETKRSSESSDKSSKKSSRDSSSSLKRKSNNSQKLSNRMSTYSGEEIDGDQDYRDSMDTRLSG